MVRCLWFVDLVVCCFSIDFVFVVDFGCLLDLVFAGLRWGGL